MAYLGGRIHPGSSSLDESPCYWQVVLLGGKVEWRQAVVWLAVARCPSLQQQWRQMHVTFFGGDVQRRESALCDKIIPAKAIYQHRTFSQLRCVHTEKELRVSIRSVQRQPHLPVPNKVFGGWIFSSTFATLFPLRNCQAELDQMTGTGTRQILILTLIRKTYSGAEKSQNITIIIYLPKVQWVTLQEIELL